MSERTIRREDARLLTGSGRYTADWNLPGQLYGFFLRSDRAHAEIVSMDVKAASARQGVHVVLTGADYAASGWKSLPGGVPYEGVGGQKQKKPFWPALAHKKAHYVGQPVALVVAELAALAQDAAEDIAVEYRDLPCGQRRLHRPFAQPGTERHARVPRRGHRPPRRENPRSHPARRRQLRNPQLFLRGARRGDARRAKARPAGEMGGDALGDLPFRQPRARAHADWGARARPRRQFPRAALRGRGGPRCLFNTFRSADRLAQHHHHHGRRVPDRGDARAYALRLFERRSGLGVPRLLAARHLLRALA